MYVNYKFKVNPNKPNIIGLRPTIGGVLACAAIAAVAVALPPFLAGVAEGVKESRDDLEPVDKHFESVHKD